MRSFMSWVGGKSRLAKRIAARFPQHELYCEVFGGAGWVLFEKGKDTSQVEVYNDVNGDLVNLFRVVKHRPSELAERLEGLPFSRELYLRTWAEIAAGGVEDEVDRAARFYFCVRSAFGSAPGQGWGFSRKAAPKRVYDPELIRCASERLQGVYVDSRDFARLISIWDSPGTLFYLDPPYTMCGKSKAYYQHTFGEEDHARLREALGGIRGRFILSYDDSPMIRKMYKDCRVEAAGEVRYSMNNRGGGSRKPELLIRNF